MNKKTSFTIIRSIKVSIVLFLFIADNVFARIDTLNYQASPSNSQVKNIIFLIGDGMGLAQIASARIKTFGASGRLHMEKMPVTGIINTYSADKLITCSAAAGTALATGYKTNNGMISINPDGKKLKTILEACKEKGMSTGLVVTCPITNATPAAFASHVITRKDEISIASQLIENRVNVLLGGGRMFFIPESEAKSKRKDDVNLIAAALETGYSYVKTKEELMTATGDYVLGLFHLEALTTNPPEPSLAEMTRKAIELLNRDENGFFLMVEGSLIDWKCHDNDVEETIRQTWLFDEAVGTALEFAFKDTNTLVIVTADHETGGMGINEGSLDGKYLDIEWTTEKHSGIPVIIFAAGPNSERFTGLHDNTEVPRIFAELLGIKNFPAITE